MIGRPFSTGSVCDAEGGVRAHLHAARLRELASSIEVHVRHAPALLAAAQAIELLSERNRSLGRKVGAGLKKRVATHRGVSFRAHDAELPAAIAEMAGDAPVTAYVGRDPGRVRITHSAKLPRGVRVLGRFDAGCDYREVKRRIEAAVGVPA